MPVLNEITRRKFIKTTGAVLAGSSIGLSCKTESSKHKRVKLGVTGFSVEAFRKVIDELGFTKKTGIEVEIVQRPNAPSELITQMTGAIYAGTSPYDVLDFEDEIANSFLSVGWFLPLDDILSSDFWDDFTKPLMEMTEVWDRYKGETFRIHHNFEPCYWWYRGDWFDKYNIEVPRSWDDVNKMGELFTDQKKGIWASEEGLIKGGFLNVYISWITLQAGGNSFDVDEKLGTSLEYIYDLMHKHHVLNPASLQKNYDQQNSDYIGNRVAFMRQWPFFFDVARQNEKWFSEEKVRCTLPPLGPSGKANSTYAAGWGYGIPKTAKNVDAAKELIRFFVEKENARKMVNYSTWFLNARYSVLAEAGDKGTAKYLKMYTDADAIATRPYRHKFMEAVAVIENAASAFFSDQIKFNQAMHLIKKQLQPI